MRNEKGFSLIEMIAVLFIASVVLLPLLVGLTGNIRVNRSLIDRSIATQVATTTIQVFEGLYFNDIEVLMEDEFVIAFNLDSGCDDLLNLSPSTKTIYTYINNQTTCERLFEIETINRSFEANEFIVFIYPFTLPEADLSAFLQYIDNDPDQLIPSERIKAKMADEVGESSIEFRVYRILVWINYGDSENQSIIRTGLISPEVEWD